MLNLTADSVVSELSSSKKLIEDNWESIPYLCSCTKDDLAEGALVRFRGMVQDMPNPVFYFSEYEVRKSNGDIEKRSGKYRDNLTCADNEDLLVDNGNSVSEERKPYYCVSVPALNDWANPTLSSSISPKPNQTEMDVPLVEECSVPKRSADTMDEDVINETVLKKVKSSGSDDSGSHQVSLKNDETPGVIDLHFPITSPDNIACILHFYDTDDIHLKVTDVVEAVGFVHVSQVVAEDGFDLPPSLVPRLHVVSYKLLSSSFPQAVDKCRTEKIFESAREVRSELHLALSQLLLGDHLAADYLLCFLFAKIYFRHDMLVLGKFSLNLSNVPINVGFAEEVHRVISDLVPNSHYFPLMIDSLNKIDLSPKKNYETNRLECGMLQLVSGTRLVIDETKLKEGKLLEKGMKNFQALSNVINFQKVDYDFKYFTKEFLTDVPVLVLSEGKSMLPTDFLVKLQPEESCSRSIIETYEAVKAYFNEELLARIRMYLLSVTESAFSLTEDLSEQIQEDFVNIRQNCKASPEELHNLLVLARFMALSFGETQLTLDVWKKTTEMEATRRSRLVAP